MQPELAESSAPITGGSPARSLFLRSRNLLKNPNTVVLYQKKARSVSLFVWMDANILALDVDAGHNLERPREPEIRSEKRKVPPTQPSLQVFAGLAQSGNSTIAALVQELLEAWSQLLGRPASSVEAGRERAKR